MGRKPSDKPCKGVMIYAETSLVVNVDALCKHLGKQLGDEPERYSNE